MVDVVLVNPPALRRSGPLKEHLGLAYLAASLRQAGFSAKIIDAVVFELDYKAINAELLASDFRVLATSILFQDSLRPVLGWLQDLRDGGLPGHFTIGGHPATFTYESILREYPCVDSVVRGEGDFTLVELVEKLNGGTDWHDTHGLVYRDGDEIIFNPPRPLISDLNSLPWPARDTYAARPGAFEQIAAVSSRGCHEYCAFCSIATFYRSFEGRAWRRRDPEDVLNEIDATRSIFPSDFVMLFDDSFIGPGKVGRRQAFEFAEALGRRQPEYILGVSCRADQVEEELFRELKRAGLKSVFLGIESGNDETLNLFNKNMTAQRNKEALAILRRLDFAVEIGFIMFNPYTTFQQVSADLDFLLESGVGPDVRHLSNLGLFPGQPLLKQIEEDGLLTGTPFGYEARFADERVNDFFYTLRDKVFRGFQGQALMAANQIIQASELEYENPSPALLSQAKETMAAFHQTVYDTLKSGAALFEEGPVKDGVIADLKQDFGARIELLSQPRTTAK